MSNSDDNRSLGVDLGPVVDELESEEYPIEKDELLEEYGSACIGLEEEGETIEEILGPLGDTTYNDVDEVLQQIVGNVSDQAVGREGYSDRGDARGEEDRDKESI